jgi:hypothetical protein
VRIIRVRLELAEKLRERMEQMDRSVEATYRAIGRFVHAFSSIDGLYGTEPRSLLAARLSASGLTILKNASSEYGCSAWSPLGAGANG